MRTRRSRRPRIEKKTNFVSGVGEATGRVLTGYINATNKLADKVKPVFDKAKPILDKLPKPPRKHRRRR